MTGNIDTVNGTREAELTMPAMVHERYGAPEQVLRPARLPVPEPKDGEVLVRVRAVPVSGTDWHLLRGLPYVARFVTGLRRPGNRIPGYDLAGTVAAVGDGVTRFAVGDEVFGWQDGSTAGFVIVPEGQLMAKPANLTLTQAAAVPIAAFTALQGVRDKGGVVRGQKVLITGASGGVGLYAVQVAKLLGAEVTGVCSGAKADLVRSVGADRVVDYTQADFTRVGLRHDVIIDLYGNPSLRGCRRALVRGGVLVLIGGTGGKWFMGTDRWLRALVAAPFLGFKPRPLIHHDTLDDLATVKTLIEEGQLKVVVDRTYPLDRMAEAIGHVTDGRARGQVLVEPWTR